MCLYIRLSQFNIKTFYPGLSLQFPGEADWLELLRVPLLCVTIRAASEQSRSLKCLKCERGPLLRNCVT